MSELRASELDPSVVTGIAVSTTLVSGDCRPLEDEPNTVTDVCGNVIETRCAHDRGPLFVVAIPINTSVPTSDTCSGGYALEEIRRFAVLDARASDLGELVAALPEGRYTLYVSHDGSCAYCGLEEVENACVIEVKRGQVSVRDLVLDRSTR